MAVVWNGSQRVELRYADVPSERFLAISIEDGDSALGYTDADLNDIGAALQSWVDSKTGGSTPLNLIRRMAGSEEVTVTP